MVFHLSLLWSWWRLFRDTISRAVASEGIIAFSRFDDDSSFPLFDFW